MIRRALLIALICGPAAGQDSSAEDGPRFIGQQDEGGRQAENAFSGLVSREMAEEDDLFIDVTERDPAAITPPDTELPPVNQLVANGTAPLTILDRCAAFESSLYTVAEGRGMGNRTSTRHRARFSAFLRRSMTLRQQDGMTGQQAQDASRTAILPLARAYLAEWEAARTRTGSYFESPLRRVDQLACATQLDGIPREQRPSLRDQIDRGAVGTFGQDDQNDDRRAGRAQPFVAESR